MWKDVRYRSFPVSSGPVQLGNRKQGLAKQLNVGSGRVGETRGNARSVIEITEVPVRTQ